MKHILDYIMESYSKGGFEIKFYKRIVNHYNIDIDKIYDLVSDIENVFPKIEKGMLIIYFDDKLYKDWNKFLDLIQDIFKKC